MSNNNKYTLTWRIFDRDRKDPEAKVMSCGAHDFETWASAREAERSLRGNRDQQKLFVSHIVSADKA